MRGVSTNIAFVENLLKHPTFLNNEYHTKFIDQTPELFQFTKRKDRGTKAERTPLRDTQAPNASERNAHADRV